MSLITKLRPTFSRQVLTMASISRYNIVIINQWVISDINEFEYAPVMPDDVWKVDMVKELIEVRAKQATIENFSDDELEEILEYLCIS